MNKGLKPYVSRARKALALAVLAGVLAALATIAQMTIVSKIVGQVFLAHATLGGVAPLAALLLAAAVVRATLLWLQEVAAQRGAIRVKSELRERLFGHLLLLGPTYCKGERTGELVAAAVDGVERLDAYVARYLPQLGLSVLVPLVVVAYILPLDWASAVLLSVTGPIIPLLMILVGSYAEARMQRQWLALSRLSAHFLDAVQGLPTLKLFGRGAAERERVAVVTEQFRDRTLKVLRVAFLSGMVLELMSSVAIALVAVTLGIRLLNGGISFEHAFLVLLLAPEFYRPLRDLGTHRHAGMEGSAAADRIFEILGTPASRAPTTAMAEAERRITTGATACTATHLLMHGGGAAWLPSIPPTIELAGVSYTYPDRSEPAIADLDLTLRAGTRTALVGRSGAGKSTVVNLLLRFIDAQHGRITVDGIPLAALPVETWRQCVALVPQRPYLFFGSVGDNIRLARSTASDEEVARAAGMAGAAEFIARLPRGYDTQIGEQGARLSAGQAQRIAIARAFLKDAPVLVLDEPTSSLDPESESLIRGALDRLMRNRTVLVVAHRLNTIYTADQIVVLERGRLVEAGRHEHLAGLEGAYARLVGAHAEVPHVEIVHGRATHDGVARDGVPA